MDSLQRELDRDGELDPHRSRTPPHTITPGNFIRTAIQIEEQQYVHFLACSPQKLIIL